MVKKTMHSDVMMPELDNPLSNGAAGIDVKKIRGDFPILATVTNGKPLIYLDNAATTQKPAIGIEALATYYREQNANIHRGVYYLSEDATDAYELTRKKVRAWLNAAETHEIIFVRGTTEAINLVANGFRKQFLHPGDEVVLSEMEHHSNIVPWQIACEESGATIRVIPINDEGELLMDEYEKLLSPKTKLVAVTHISNVLGTINPIRQIVELAHAQGIPVLVDGAQAVPHTKVDVRALDCDFYAFSAHKMYGPPARRIVRQIGMVGEIARLSRRRRHDPLGDVRENDVQFPAE